jgi:hypothetical protein
MAKAGSRDTASDALRKFNERVIIQIELTATATEQSQEAVITSEELVARGVGYKPCRLAVLADF